jgi:hypothetical protein
LELFTPLLLVLEVLASLETQEMMVQIQFLHPLHRLEVVVEEELLLLLEEMVDLVVVLTQHLEISVSELPVKVLTEHLAEMIVTQTPAAVVVLEVMVLLVSAAVQAVLELRHP